MTSNVSPRMSPDDIRLRWVQADPSIERAVDPLGMGAQADRIADFLLPQLSVTTSRARYLSFLCWAVRKSAGSLPMIHRLEAELALEEAQRHQGDSSDTCPGIVGRRTALKYLQKYDWKPPKRPERLYKITAFATHRPTLRSLKLLTDSRSPELTEEGGRLATLFEQSRGRKPRCLGDISRAEISQIKALLGFDNRKQAEPSTPSGRRRATYDGVWRKLQKGDSAFLLEQYARCSTRSSPVAAALHRAYVWEVLSCGLALALLRLLWERNLKTVAGELRKQLKRRPRCPGLGKFSADNDDSPG